MIGQLTYSQSLEPLNSKFTGTKIQYSERNFEYSWSISDYSERKSCGKVAVIVFFRTFAKAIAPMAMILFE